MPRRKPASANQRKAELKIKRAIKRGDLDPEDKPTKNQQNRSARTRPVGDGAFSGDRSGPQPSTSAGLSSRHLQSSFVKLSPEFLAVSKGLASTLVLPRPIDSSRAILSEQQLGAIDNNGLVCPKRPKWRYDMEKKEVERNEEALFNKWLAETDLAVEKWRNEQGEQPGSDKEAQDSEDTPKEPTSMPQSPTYFERNLEVWRQLWRVTEISQILMVLLDSRAPLVHFPLSLYNYLTALKPAKKLILILTKVDVVGLERATAWKSYLETKYPGVRVVLVESYRERDPHDEGKGQGKRKHFDPFIPRPFLLTMVETLKEMHEELLVPPSRIAEDPAKLEKWEPPVVRKVDWNAALGGAANSVVEPDSSADTFLTIGLIGQPNVGKSSLLNALFGSHKVKASRTPGKTKHFQTLFWTPHIRLVDCPGLVFPNLVGLEMQVLVGILPISQIPSIPSCIHFAAGLLPIETIFNLRHPSTTAQPVEDRRTWRAGQKEKVADDPSPPGWTAMDILTAFAEKQGWVTAKAGRPDVNRGGNAILRALAESKVAWGFWPPSSGSNVRREDPGTGIWLGGDGAVGVYDDDEDESEEEEPMPAGNTNAADGTSGSEEVSEPGSDSEVVGIRSRYAALLVEDEEDGSGNEDES